MAKTKNENRLLIEQDLNEELIQTLVI